MKHSKLEKALKAEGSGVSHKVLEPEKSECRLNQTKARYTHKMNPLPLNTNKQSVPN